ncbi:MAG: P27 family phage terminase small subunit [Rhodospirillales bacterium]|jgi:P27 family predicted phage terminase small subunit|nr:P27 family phage terminase small subunit [Rhodospirillales bacterium]
MNEPIKPPTHLEKETKAWWAEVAAEYELEAHHLRTLTLACEQWDRAQAARKLIKKEGIAINDRFGQPKPHPAVAIERSASVAFARLMRELALDDTDPSRPPRVGGGT